ncbi:MAG: tripartite tricarboxylate transporter substrate binding protein [Rhodospirillales bacterium]|nr:tripartite tricarboxylate transporter substrate binding protein [Rhodospirillales bacterium]
MMKRRLVVPALLALASACAVPSAKAQSYPSRPITLVVPFPAGGSVDVMAREIAAGLGRQLKQVVIVDNKAGAGGTIGSAAVANAAPDGYTLLFGTTSALAVAPALYSKVAYDPLKSFVPIIEATRGPFVISVRPTLPVRDLKELIEYAKKNPGKLNGGSAGLGSVHHLSLEMFKQAAGVDIVHVPFKGGAPAWAALLSEDIDIVFDSMPGPLLFPGRVKPLAVAGPSRLAKLPDVPTFAEGGLPDVSAVFFWAILAPAGTPPAIVKTLNAALNDVLRDPKVKEAFVNQSMETTPGTAEEIARFMADDIPRWRAAVERAGLKQE